MRPDKLNPLFADVTTLPGIGPKLAPLIAKVAGPRVVDMLFTLPTGLIDRSARPTILTAPEGELATLTVQVEKHTPPPRGRQRIPYKVLCSDETGYITLVFFHAREDYLQRQLPEGETRIVSGRIERFGAGLQMTHPDHIITPDQLGDLPLIEPVYPLTDGLAAKTMRKAAHAAEQRAPNLPDWMRGDIMTTENWPGWQPAIHTAHRPETTLDLSAQSVTRQRLAYDELLANQLALALIRRQRRKTAGRSLKGDGHLRNQIAQRLPFRLTGDQSSALGEIMDDMVEPRRMIRLLQGDVGSGKTIVALMAMLNAVEAGCQAVMMAPTEILARQHLATIEPLLKDTPLVVELFTGRDKGLARQAKLRGISEGYIHILIGTHAVFAEDVQYSDLGFVIVDEQHRFGVHQRLALQEKGRRADILVMTATPIPRTLALTTYGDMEVSQIREKPPGRKSVDTRAVPLEKIDEVTGAVSRAVKRGEQVYWVCPLVETTDTVDLTSAEARYESLAQALGDNVGLVHGRMKGEQKDAVVDAFYKGSLRVLVATTVIEVGVNAPDATIIVIEHAERFGLAQLHQLRGRVGRGDRKATCLLLYRPGENGQLGETAKARLNILRETEDGFLIAEEDLRLRGAGDALGAAQSGFPRFRLADMHEHARLLEMASDDAAIVVESDPDLTSDRGHALRHLLYLFSRDDAVKLLRSG